MRSCRAAHGSAPPLNCVRRRGYWRANFGDRRVAKDINSDTIRWWLRSMASSQACGKTRRAYASVISPKYVITTSGNHALAARAIGYTARPGKVTLESIFRIRRVKRSPIKWGRYCGQWSDSGKTMAKAVDRYTYRVTWSEEDNEYVGLCAEFPSLSWLEATPEGALVGIRSLVKKVVADLKRNKEPVPGPISTRPYSGKFVVRVPPEVHRLLAIQAAESGVSLNRLVSSKLA